MYTSLIDREDLQQRLDREPNIIKLLKETLQCIDIEQDKQFNLNCNIVHLVHQRALSIDDILIIAWQYTQLDQFDAALIAVGGYGRSELHPKSDVDILILHEDLKSIEDPESELSIAIQQLITLLWDIGLDIGHSVRTASECIAEASQDITIISNLMESRLITGSEKLFSELQKNIGPQTMWPTREFFHGKMKEQHNRHLKYNDTAYNLEPNIKEGPGGLRDIQIIGWITRRHFNADTLKELVTYKFLTAEEYAQLELGQSFLWKIRYALHRLKNKSEERLLFDYQRDLAVQFGYQDNEEKLAVEQFMGDYYQNIMELERLNEILLQYFSEVILYQDEKSKPKKINNRFVVYKNYISTSNPNVFAYYPFALLEIFLILAENPKIKGVRASTIRQIRAHHYLIDDSFRKDLRCRALFIEILRQQNGITAQLRRMNRYGVLAEYIPAFKQIVGQMQHDLYHAYTVDEHTLRVLRNVRRLSVDKYLHEFPLASQIFNRIHKPELLYIAALFHDIGKGRGGNHDLLGSQDAETFCQQHDMSSEDVRLVSWLVRNHLIMSMVAQRKDLGDPQVIHDFALQIKDMVHLNYLYLLTICDIRATSPKVWNSWKDSLLIELYKLTKKALGKGLENPIEQKEKILLTKAKVVKILRKKQLSEKQYLDLWETLPKDYFLQHKPKELAWHTHNIIEHDKENGPLVSIRNQKRKGSTEILIFMKNKKHVFALVTSVLAGMKLNVTEANTYRTTTTCIIHTYHILDEQNQPVKDQERIDKIQLKLHKQLTKDEFTSEPDNTRIPRTLKQFSMPTEVSFSEDMENNWTIMDIRATNRPFMLSKIGKVLIKHDIHLVNARISTFGEKVEDVFYLTDLSNHIITDFQKLKHLEIDLIKVLDETND